VFDELDPLNKAAAVVAAWARCVIRVSGREPLSFLHATTTQDLLALAPGQGALTCVLNDKGRVLAEARVLPLEDGTVLLDGEPSARTPLLEGLGRVAPLSGCELLDETQSWSVAAVRGPAARAALPGIPELPQADHQFVVAGGAIVVRTEWGVPGYDVLAPAGVDVAIDALSVETETLEAARIAAGRPRFGVDVTDELLINETPLLERAVSFSKGCYPGQESVARVQNLGRVRRSLLGLRIDAPSPPAPGTVVTREGDEVGRITSAASIDGACCAIALLRNDGRMEGEVTVGGARAFIHPLSLKYTDHT
jgi:folate-binding protein YgfZ